MVSTLLNASSITSRSAPGIPPHISQLTGSQFIGILMNWGLLGVLSVQIYIYHLCFHHKDSRTIKSLVYGLYVLEIIQTAMSTSDGFNWFSYGWGDLDVLDNPLISPWDSPFLDGIIALAIQVFFSWRIYRLGKNAFFPIILVLIALASAGGGFATGIRAFQLGHISLIRKFLGPELGTWLGGAALVDTLIAISMTSLLLRHKNHVKRTNRIITRIITLTIETNSLTAGVATVTFILFFACPDKNYFICPPYILGKLYSNTLLVVFNNRLILHHEALARAEAGNGLVSLEFADMVHFSGSRADTRRHSYPPRPGGVVVNVRKEITTDAIALDGDHDTVSPIDQKRDFGKHGLSEL